MVSGSENLQAAEPSPRKMKRFQLIFLGGKFVERHSFNTRKLGEITVLYIVPIMKKRL